MANPPRITSARRPGRPRVEEPGTSVSVWLRATDHDKLIRLANRRECSVAEVLRRGIAAGLRDHAD